MLKVTGNMDVEKSTVKVRIGRAVYMCIKIGCNIF